MKIDYHLEMQGNLMADVNAGVPLEKAAQVRLDNLGQIKSRSCFINDPGRLERLRQRFELLRSCGAMEAAGRQEAAEKRDADKAKLDSLLPDAIRMYSQGDQDKRAFTKAHIRTILISIFEATTASSSDSLKKSDLLKELIQQEKEKPDAMIAAIEHYVMGVSVQQLESAAEPEIEPELPPLPPPVEEMETQQPEPPASPTEAAPAAASLSNPIATLAHEQM
jgi:hypothetical protein